MVFSLKVFDGSDGAGGLVEGGDWFVLDVRVNVAVDEVIGLWEVAEVAPKQQLDSCLGRDRQDDVSRLTFSSTDIRALALVVIGRHHDQGAVAVEFEDAGALAAFVLKEAHKGLSGG
jgi:hypothetical protein